MADWCNRSMINLHFLLLQNSSCNAFTFSSIQQNPIHKNMPADASLSLRKCLSPGLDSTFIKEHLIPNHHMLLLLNHLSFGLDGRSLVQEDLDDSHMAVPGSTVQRGQLILTGTKRKTDGDIYSYMYAAVHLYSSTAPVFLK